VATPVAAANTGITHRDPQGMRGRLVSGLWSGPGGTRPGTAPSRASDPVAARRAQLSTTVAGAAPAFDRLPNSPAARTAGT